MSSVGQMSGLIKFMKLVMTIQNTRLDAARFRFLICQMNGGKSMMSVINASIGSATALGVTGKVDSSIMNDVRKRCVSEVYGKVDMLTG